MCGAEQCEPPKYEEKRKRKDRDKKEKRQKNEGLWNESKHTTRKKPGQTQLLRTTVHSYCR